MKHTKSLATLVLISSAALGLAACGSSTDLAKTGSTASASSSAEQPVSAPSSVPVPVATPTSDEKKSVRGNLIANVGDTGTISDGSSGKVTTKFTVNSIKPIKCNQAYSRAAQNGQIIAVDVSVETTPDLAQSSFPTYDLTGYDFKFIATNGTTFNGNLSTVATYSCIPDAETFPSAGMGPAEKITAKVVLDVPAAHGILVLKSGYNGGFEYKF